MALSRQVVKPSSRKEPPAREEPVFSFERLETYQAARAFKQRVYKLVKLLPREERFRLCDQMPRAVLSISNAIAEGHGRYTYRDRKHYCHEARGSLQELVDDINDCIDRSYAKRDHLIDLKWDAFRLLQLIDGYARYLEREHQKTNATRKQRKSPTRLDDSTT